LIPFGVSLAGDFPARSWKSSQSLALHALPLCMPWADGGCVEL
jgi:hypothetical protein